MVLNPKCVVRPDDDEDDEEADAFGEGADEVEVV